MTARRPRAWHRSAMAAAGVGALIWAASGVLHPIMSWTAPRPAVQAPPACTVSTLGAAAPALLPAMRAVRTDMLRLETDGGAAHWLAREGRALVAFDAQTGAPAPTAPADRAKRLAAHYAAVDSARIKSVDLVDRFTSDYPEINRILPVYRVRFDGPDALDVFVDPMTDRLAAVTDARRRALLSVFQKLHTMSLLDGAEPVRLIVIAALVGAALVASLSGVAMLMRPGGRTPLRRAHRAIGWIAGPAMALFAATGLFHLFASTTLFGRTALPAAASFEASLIMRVPPLADGCFFSATGDDGGRAVVRLLLPDRRTTLYFDGAGRELPLDDAARARMIGGASADAPVRLIERFSGDYGFENKRLPVMAVEQGDRTVFADPLEGLVATEYPSWLKRIEAWSFGKLHKYGVLDSAGKKVRDAILVAMAAFVLAAASIGLLLRHLTPSSRPKRGDEPGSPSDLG